MTRIHTFRVVAFVLSTACATAAFAQTAAKSAKYDPASEIAVTGNIKNVISAPGEGGQVGVHVQLNTPKGVMWVSVGPALFIGENNFYFFADDNVQVTGAAIGSGEDATLWARTITKGGKTLTLRNPDGTPRWKTHDELDGCGVSHDRIR